ncbi:MAG: ParB/RepB/Spo0J family partition protein [Clostridia bacterium]|nr:ParB/RepB/Spo0J family partition protein [Clostridia bacterium]
MSILQPRDFKKISVDDIVPNPNQPRRIFDPDAISQLAESIKSCGIITPLTVRRSEKGGYELIAGERRLRASRLAGLRQVPCYILDADEEGSSFMAVVENLQRKDLDFFEEALSLRALIDKYGLTQQQTAERIGKTQSSVANKLRLLKLSPEAVRIIRESHLSERHARALLRLPAEQQALGAETAVIKALNVEQTEKLVDDMLKDMQKPPKTDGKTAKSPKRDTVYIKDVRIFLNTLARAVKTMEMSGVRVKVDRFIEREDTVVTVRIGAGKR